MRLNSKAIAALGVIAAVVILGFWLGWFGGRRPSPAPGLDPGTEPTPAATGTNGARFLTKHGTGNAQDSVTGQLGSEAIPSNTNLLADWQDKVEAVLRPDTEPSAKGRKLLELLPRIPEDGQLETVQHAANLLADADYEPLGKMLADPKTSTNVLDVLLVDVLNRPNSIKLPALLQMARAPGHPKAAEAKDLLQLHLEEDFGDDWNKWEEKLNQWLKDNPD